MEKILLNGKWLFRDLAGENPEEFSPAWIPGTVHTDLLKNNIIPDPFLEKTKQRYSGSSKCFKKEG